MFSFGVGGTYVMLVTSVTAGSEVVGPQIFMKRPESNPLIRVGGVPAEVAQFTRVGAGMASLPVGVPGVHWALGSTSAQGLLLFACSCVLVVDVVSVASKDPR